ncbi:hypothetical protein O181_016513 [Austropuccinia psidii MF-1]|uniref:Uncharacterized protein n=1 Tax=Austropuccinia psidii MF-1 TaxID=1389203 RepID=A0A9Q3GQY2_9BASI|nr:hypothetical protein [Austropuccinia psidii MF-1]
MALNLGPNSSPKTFPEILGKVRFLWCCTLSMGPGHLGEELVHGHSYGAMDPLEVWPWGALVTPRTIGPIKGQRTPKRPKKAKMAPHHQLINNGHGIGQTSKFRPISRTQTPSLDDAKRPIKVKWSQEKTFPSQ